MVTAVKFCWTHVVICDGRPGAAALDRRDPPPPAK